MPTLCGYRPKRAHLVFTFCGIVVAMLAACFWPFEFNPRNGVEWLKGENGLRFSGKGQAMSRALFPTISHPAGDGSLTIEIAVRPLKLDGSRMAYILSFFSETGPPLLSIGTWKSSLWVQVSRPDAAPGAKRAPWMWLYDSLVRERTLFITVVARQQGTSLYLDGRLRGDFPAVDLPDGAFTPGRLLLGNSLMGGNGWKGELLAVAVYARALSANEVAKNFGAWSGGTLPGLSAQEAVIARYDFAEGEGVVAGSKHGLPIDLLIPSVFKPLRRTVLARPPREAKARQIFNLDVALNVLGFMPFGFLAMSVVVQTPRISDRRQSLNVVCSGFAFSLAIELTQVFIPARSSSLIDLAANTIGTAAGVVLFFGYKQRVAGCAVEARSVEG